MLRLHLPLLFMRVCVCGSERERKDMKEYIFISLVMNALPLNNTFRAGTGASTQNTVQLVMKGAGVLCQRTSLFSFSFHCVQQTIFHSFFCTLLWCSSAFLMKPLTFIWAVKLEINRNICCLMCCSLDNWKSAAVTPSTHPAALSLSFEHVAVIMCNLNGKPIAPIMQWQKVKNQEHFFFSLYTS